MRGATALRWEISPIRIRSLLVLIPREPDLTLTVMSIFSVVA
jgi:hypothetical protein